MILTALGERRKQGGGITYPSVNSSYLSWHLLLKATATCNHLQSPFFFLVGREHHNPAIRSSCSKKLIKLMGKTAMKEDNKKFENIYFKVEADMETR